MKRSGILAATAGLACLALALPPAAATHGGNHPTFASRNVYFHCSEPTKVYQANWLLSGSISGGAAPWNATPPAGSAADGAGCGALDAGGVSNELYDAVFEGTFMGNLRDLTLRIFEFGTNQTRSGATKQLRLYAEVDGIPVFPGGTPDTGYTGRTVTVTPTRMNNGATDLYELSITNLGYAKDVFDADGKLIDVETGGLARENGNGTEEHTLRLFVGGQSFTGGDPITGWQAWVWDTTEVPSGITFNPSSLAAARVAADLPFSQ